MERMEAIRRKAGVLMGMGDVSKAVVPKIGAARASRATAARSRRATSCPTRATRRIAVTGTVCVASACAIPGTVASQIAPLPPAPQGMIEIEHPSGMIAIDLDADFTRRQAGAAPRRADPHRAPHFRRQRARARAGVGRQASADPADDREVEREARRSLDSRMNVAVIGGGYAGMAAAVTLADAACRSRYTKPAPQLGGRARRVVVNGVALDNGLHILHRRVSRDAASHARWCTPIPTQALAAPAARLAHPPALSSESGAACPRRCISLRRCSPRAARRGASAWRPIALHARDAPRRLPPAARHDASAPCSQRTRRAPRSRAICGSRCASPRSTRRPRSRRRRFF